MSDTDAETVYSVLSLSKHNIFAIDTTGPPFPIIFEYTGNTVIKSLAGLNGSPFEYLLRSLRHAYPRDYDKNQNKREASMVRAVTRTLHAVNPRLIFMKGVKIRGNGNVLTDIDFSAWDASAGELILFQLKHQDPFGSDMKQRRNRSGKLKGEVEKWFSTIEEWINKTRIDSIKSSLRIKKSTHLEKSDIYKIVLTKNFAHFLSETEMPDNACYSTWFQYISILDKVKDTVEGDIKLSEIYLALENSMAHKIAESVSVSDPIKIQLSGMNYTILQ